MIQVTGRENYRLTGIALGIQQLEHHPELLEDKTNAARSAGHFWKSHGFNALADDFSNDDDDADFVAITVAINGGKKGLKERREFWSKARQVLGA